MDQTQGPAKVEGCSELAVRAQVHRHGRWRGGWQDGHSQHPACRRHHGGLHLLPHLPATLCPLPLCCRHLQDQLAGKCNTFTLQHPTNNLSHKQTVINYLINIKYKTSSPQSCLSTNKLSHKVCVHFVGNVPMGIFIQF